MRNINDELTEFAGTENYYPHNFGIKYTDGVKHLCEEFKCYWLLDLIGSYKFNQIVNKEAFLSYKLERVKEDEFKVIISNGNDPLTFQDIPFSDFEGDEVTLWLVDNITMLPSEY